MPKCIERTFFIGFQKWRVACALFIPGYLNLKVSNVRYIKVSLVVLLFVPSQSISGPKKSKLSIIEDYDRMIRIILLTTISCTH